MKISSWNIAGVRAWTKKNGCDYVRRENPDILCLQELKCSQKAMPDELKMSGYHTYWNCNSGDFGVAILSKIEPINVDYGFKSKFESEFECRSITAEYEDFYLVCVYVPNSSRGLGRTQELFSRFLLY